MVVLNLFLAPDPIKRWHAPRSPRRWRVWINQEILLGNRFHVTLRIVSPTDCKYHLRVER